MGNVFGGGSSSQPQQVQTSRVDQQPWAPQQPHLKNVFGEAENLFRSEIPQFFPGDTVVPQSPETLGALQATTNRAAQGNVLNPQAQQYTSDVLGGNFLGGNPFFGDAFEAQVKPAVRQFQNVVQPGIDSKFAQGGRLGSALHGQARGDADATFAEALSDTAGKLAFSNYGQERGMQQQAAAAAPGMAELDYNDINRLAGVGGARESFAQAQLQSEMDRFNFGQQTPFNKLAQYSGLVGGPIAGTTTTQQPIFRQPAASFLGGAALGGSIGNKINPDSGWGAGLGALGGGLLGLGF